MKKIEQRMIDAIDKRQPMKVAHTRVYPQDDCIEVWLHATQIATVYPDHIVLRSGGWLTETTKRRLNAILRYYTNYWLSQKDYAWTIEGKGVSLLFIEGMSVPRR